MSGRSPARAARVPRRPVCTVRAQPPSVRADAGVPPRASPGPARTPAMRVITEARTIVAALHVRARCASRIDRRLDLPRPIRVISKRRPGVQWAREPPAWPNQRLRELRKMGFPPAPRGCLAPVRRSCSSSPSATARPLSADVHPGSWPGMPSRDPRDRAESGVPCASKGASAASARGASASSWSIPLRTRAAREQPVRDAPERIHVRAAVDVGRAEDHFWRHVGGCPRASCDRPS